MGTISTSIDDENATLPPRSVLLLPGWGAGYSNFERIENLIREKRLLLQVVPKLSRASNQVSELVKEMSAFVKENVTGDFYIVGFGNAGVVVTTYLQIGDDRERCLKGICIGTVNRSFTFKNLSFLFFHKLREPEEVKIALTAETLKKVINIFPYVDSKIIPDTPMYLEGADNRQLPPFQGLNVLEHPELLKILGEELN